MYYIDDYRYQAIDKIIPYLIEFPQVVKIIENSADRYQAIEDLLWKVAENLKVTESRGIFLNAHAHNEVVNFNYTDKAQDAFTYGTDRPLYQAYGTGHYYSQASYISGSKKNVSEEKTIRAVLAQIIQNNTNCTIEDIIEDLKLMHNATRVEVYESNPLNISVMLEGNNLELSSSGNYENIKKMLATCVSLKNIYVNPYTYDIFKYDDKTAYGISRYPVRVGDTVDIYSYKSHAINLSSLDNEYIKTNHNKLEDGLFCCISGEFTGITDNSTLFSSKYDDNNKIEIKLITDSNNKKRIALDYNNTIYADNEFEIVNGSRYTIVLYNKDNTLRLWITNSIPLRGDYDTDTSFLEQRILYIEPSITIDNYNTINAPIYINSENGLSNFADFTYYVIMFGFLKENIINLSEYYTTSCGEKQIVFNCISNIDHLPVYTNNILAKNITITQPYFNYLDNHSLSKYLYLDGKSSIDYKILEEDVLCDIQDIDISFDLCMPTEIKKVSNILDGVIGDSQAKSKIYINENNGLSISIPSLGQGGTYNYAIYSTPNDIIDVNEYANFRFNITENNIYIYKNDLLINETELLYPISNYASDMNIGNNFKGFIRNLSIKMISIDSQDYNYNIVIPFEYTLKDLDKIITYINNGARFITVPQLMNDTTNLDLYGNALIGRRK